MVQIQFMQLLNFFIVSPFPQFMMVLEVVIFFSNLVFDLYLVKMINLTFQSYFSFLIYLNQTLHQLKAIFSLFFILKFQISFILVLSYVFLKLIKLFFGFIFFFLLIPFIFSFFNQLTFVFKVKLFFFYPIILIVFIVYSFIIIIFIVQKLLYQAFPIR